MVDLIFLDCPFLKKDLLGALFHYKKNGKILEE